MIHAIAREKKNPTANRRRIRKRTLRHLFLETLEKRQLFAAGIAPASDPSVSLYDYDGVLLSNWREIAGNDAGNVDGVLASGQGPQTIGSGNQNIDVAEFNALYSWPQPGGVGSALTVTYSFSNLLDGNLGGSLTNGQLRSAAEEALGLWATFAPLNFVEIADTGPVVSDDTSYIAGASANLRIGHHNFDGPSGTLAHAYYPSTTFFGIAGDVHMDVGENWKLGAGGGIDILEVFTHEIGHAIGLGHESTNAAIMGAFYGGRFSGLGTGFLLADDINGIRNIYGTGTGSVTPIGSSNDAPTLAQINDFSIPFTTDSVDVTLVGADVNGDTLTYTAVLVDDPSVPTAGASDVTLSLSGNVLTINPAGTYAGTVRVRATVSDGQATATREFDLTVTNDAPTLTQINDFSIPFTTDSVDVTLVGADVNGDTLTYTAVLVDDPSVPTAGASDVTLSLSGNVLTINPTGTYVGTVRVRATVSDGQATATREFDLTVTNDAPTLGQISNFNMSTNTDSVDVTLIGVDLNGDTLTYSAVLVDDPSVPTAGASDVTLSFSGNVLTINPTSNYVGTIRIRATVTDGQATATREFDLTVANDAPTLGLISNFNMSSNTDSVDVTLVGADVNGDALTYSAVRVDDPSVPTAGASDVALSISGNVLTINPTSNYVGVIRIQASVTDGLTTAMRQFDVTVTNNAPVLSTVADQTISYTQDTLTVSVVATDADGDALTFWAQATTQPDAIQTLAYGLNQQHQFQAAAGESYNFRGVGEKYFNGSGGQWFYILPQGQVYQWGGSIAASTLLGQLDSSYHGDLNLLFNAPNPAPAPANVALSWSGNQLTIDPANGFLGTFLVSIGAGDGINTAVGSFDVSVTSSAPVIAPIPNQNFSSSLDSITLTVGATDADGDALTLTASAAAANPVQTQAYTLQNAHQFRSAGGESYNIRGQGEKYFYGDGSAWFYIIPNGEIYQWGGSIAGSTLVGTLDSTYHANLNLLYNAQPPAGGGANVALSFSGNQLTIDPAAGYEGTFQVTVNAFDGTDTTTSAFDVTVSNNAPVITDIPDQNLSLSQDFVILNVIATDADGDSLTLSATANQVDPIQAQAYALQNAHQFRSAGSESYNFRGQGEKYFLGDGSAWHYILPTGAIYKWGGSMAGSTLVGTLDSTYHANLNLLYNVQQPSGGGANVALSFSGNQLTVNPANGYEGTFQVTVSAFDGTKTTDSSFDVTVTNNAPVITPLPDQSFPHNQDSITVTVGATDPDGDPLTLTATAAVANPVQETAYTLQTARQFRTAGNELYNLRGQSEKYFLGDGSAWFYIVPNGAIYQWGGSIAGSTLVGTLDSTYHADLNLLFNVQQPSGGSANATLSFSGNQLTINPDNSYSGTFEVTVSAFDGAKTTTSTFDVTVISTPPVIATVPTQTIASGQNATTVLINASDADGDTLVLNATAEQVDAIQTLAYAAQNEHQFFAAAGESYNIRGQGEKYFYGDGGAWFYIVPSGGVYRWGGSIAASTLVETLDSTYHADLTRLYNVQQPTPTPVAANLTWSGNNLTIDRPAGLVGTFFVTAQVTSNGETATTTFTVVVQPLVGSFEVAESGSLRADLSQEDTNQLDAEIFATDNLLGSRSNLRGEVFSSPEDGLAKLEARTESLLASRASSDQDHAVAIEQLVDELDDILRELNG